ITLAPVNGVRVAGLKITVFPATNAGAIFQTGIETGKFQGAIAATTPRGCLSVYAKFFGSSLGRVSPPTRRPSPAMNSRMLMDFWTSPSASFSVLPSSRVIKRASSSFCCSINAAAFAITRLRTGAGVSRQAGNAARAADTASRVSSRVESGAKPITSSRSAGFRRCEARHAEDVTRTVELTDCPGLFRAKAVDGSDEIRIGDGVRGLLQLPKILGKSGDRSRWIVDNLGAVETEDARAFGKVAVVAYVHADARVARLENLGTCLFLRKIKILPKPTVGERGVGLSLFFFIAG